jgi:uncharacterized protein (TIGR03382 family)
VLGVSGSVLGNVTEVDLANWKAEDGFGDLGNTSSFMEFPVGAVITGVEWLDLSYVSPSNSGLSELVLSVNELGRPAGGFWDARPFAAGNFSGAYGPASGAFDADTTYLGGSFTSTSGVLVVTVYDIFNDSPPDTDQLIRSGTLRITWEIPAPGAAMLGAMGGLVALRRRR